MAVFTMITFPFRNYDRTHRPFAERLRGAVVGVLKETRPSAENEVLLLSILAFFRRNHIDSTMLNTGPLVEDLDFKAAERCTVVCLAAFDVRPGTVIYDQAKLLSSSFELPLVSATTVNAPAELHIENPGGADHDGRILFNYNQKGLTLLPILNLSTDDVHIPAFAYLRRSVDGVLFHSIPKQLTKYRDLVIREDPLTMTLDQWNTAFSSARFILTDNVIFALLFSGYLHSENVRILGISHIRYINSNPRIDGFPLRALIRTGEEMKKEEIKKAEDDAVKSVTVSKPVTVSKLDSNSNSTRTITMGTVIGVDLARIR
jgi:hypothetical protein